LDILKAAPYIPPGTQNKKNKKQTNTKYNFAVYTTADKTPPIKNGPESYEKSNTDCPRDVGPVRAGAGLGR
jgi:hypothetical protein